MSKLYLILCAIYTIFSRDVDMAPFITVAVLGFTLYPLVDIQRQSKRICSAALATTTQPLDLIDKYTSRYFFAQFTATQNSYDFHSIRWHDIYHKRYCWRTQVQCCPRQVNGRQLWSNLPTWQTYI